MGLMSFPLRSKLRPELLLVDALLYSFTIIVTLCVVSSNRSLVFVARADSEVTILRTFSHAVHTRALPPATQIMAAYGGVTLRKVIPPVEMEDDDLMSEEFERQAKIASQAAEEEEPEYEEEEEDLSRYMSKDNASPPKNKDDMKRALAESRKCGKVWVSRV